MTAGDPAAEEVGAVSPAAARSKYFVPTKKREEPKPAEEEPEARRNNLPIMKFPGGVEFMECPVPILTEGLQEREDLFANFLVNLVNWAEAAGQLPAAGGLLDQANVFYEARMVVLGEQNKVEREKQEESRKQMEKNKKNKHSGGKSKSLG